MENQREVDFVLFYCENDTNSAERLLKRLKKLGLSGYLYNDAEYGHYGYKSNEEMCKSAVYKLVYITKTLVRNKQLNFLQHPAIEGNVGRSDSLVKPVYKASESDIPDESPLSILKQHSGLYVDDDDETFLAELKSRPGTQYKKQLDGHDLGTEVIKDRTLPVYGTTKDDVLKMTDDSESKKTKLHTYQAQLQLDGYYKVSKPILEQASWVEMYVKRSALQNETDINSFNIICHKVDEKDPDINKLGRPMSMVFEFLPHRYDFREPISVRFSLSVNKQYNVKALTVFSSDTDGAEPSKWIDTYLDENDHRNSETRWLFWDGWCYMNLNHFSKYIVIEKTFPTGIVKAIPLRSLLFVKYNHVQKCALLSLFFTCHCNSQHLLKKIERKEHGTIVDRQSFLLYQNGGHVKVEVEISSNRWKLNDKADGMFSWEELYYSCEHDYLPRNETFSISHDTDKAISKAEQIMVTVKQLPREHQSCPNRELYVNDSCPKLKWFPGIESTEKEEPTDIVNNQWIAGLLLWIAGLLLFATKKTVNIPWNFIKWMFNKVTSNNQTNEDDVKPPKLNDDSNKKNISNDLCEGIDEGDQLGSVDGDNKCKQPCNVELAHFCDSEETFVKQRIPSDCGEEYVGQYSEISDETCVKQSYRLSGEEIDGKLSNPHFTTDNKQDVKIQLYQEPDIDNFFEYLQPLLQYLNNNPQKLDKLSKVIGIGNHNKLNAEMLVQVWYRKSIKNVWYREFNTYLRAICDDNLYPHELLSLALQKRNLKMNISCFIPILTNVNSLLRKLKKVRVIPNDQYLSIEEPGNIKQLIEQVILKTTLEDFKNFKRILATEVDKDNVYKVYKWIEKNEF